VSLDDGAAPIDAYSFDFGDASAITSQAIPDATHTYSTVGWFNITATVTDTNGLSSATSVAVRVHAKPSTIVPDLVGLSTKGAKYTLKDADLKGRRLVKVLFDWPEGAVYSQSLRPGKLVSPGTRVTYTIVDWPRCHPAYKGACLDPHVTDYDCINGEGDGPEFTGRVRVPDPSNDPYDLDRDGDGFGCDTA